QNALVGGDSTLVGGLVSALTLLLVNRAITAIVARVPGLEHRMIGDPVVLVSDGQPRWRVMQKQGVTREELQAAMRERGEDDLEDVRLAVLEVDGTISVIPQDDGGSGTRRRRVRGLR